MIQYKKDSPKLDIEKFLLFITLIVFSLCTVEFSWATTWYVPGEFSTIKDTLFYLTNNFWWLTDSASIDPSIYGINSFSPLFFKLEDSAPGRPSEVTSLG